MNLSGNPMGAIKAKLGLKGKTKPGEMIARMNALKNKGGAFNGAGRLSQAKGTIKNTIKKTI